MNQGEWVTVEIADFGHLRITFTRPPARLLRDRLRRVLRARWAAGAW